MEGSGVGSGGCVVHSSEIVVEGSGVGSGGCVVHSSEIVNPYITHLYLWGLGLINPLLTSRGLLLGSPKNSL